ncbi:MAG: K+/H+ antiporter subunit F [Tepidimonas sp.]|uniref:K+/H+ antiporter subunit F n=1 Tax=Tepidimonas sp. TaxID=2002775 RepID=UPI004054F305
MSPLLWWSLNIGMVIIAASVLLCSWRLLRGPELPDRILALDTLYTGMVAIVIVLAIRFDTALLFEAALIVAMMGFVSTVALARYITRGDVVE